ncbi:MAG: hypothetical protein HY220_02000 [Candidatus Sungbacteria bacterium]|uniref:Uncharacterized protein n=1 Tax=Candidatus Sungiibacteriota bacterium TaxID=2750080 RepID=A0A9D6LR29_9BACT|nr:hypothetical protein [Candidatus Sungbacteria bacterium]
MKKIMSQNLYPPKFFSYDNLLFQGGHTAAEKLGWVLLAAATFATAGTLQI